LNTSQFRVHEPVGMQTPTHTAKVPGQLTQSKVLRPMKANYTHHKR
jgi:hypothetical protein